MSEDKTVNDETKDDVTSNDTTDENVTNNKEEQHEEHQPTPSQARAMEAGWRPKEEWDGDPEDWVDAAEFNRRGELFTKIESQRKELNELRKTMRSLQDHNAKIREAEFDRALKLLKEQKREALEAGEHDKVVSLDDEIDEVRDQKAEAKARETAENTQTQGPDPRFLRWVEDNKWYAQDPEMRQMADDIGTAYAKSHPGSDPSDVLKYVEGRVRKVYPEKFANPRRDRANAVEGSAGVRKTPSQKSDDDVSDVQLTEDEERVMRNFVRQKVMTADEYKKQIKELDRAGRR